MTTKPMEGRVSTLARLLAWAAVCAFASACATPPPQGPAPGRSGQAHDPAPVPGESVVQENVVQTALAMIGRPYKWGGNSPQGFDCSGLVQYSYGAAGISGLPHAVERLRNLATPIGLADLQPGDLLFFQLTGKKSSHVGIYVGQRNFVHAPSSGKSVEKVSFDHVYWGQQLKRASAGRIHR